MILLGAGSSAFGQKGGKGNKGGGGGKPEKHGNENGGGGDKDRGKGGNKHGEKHGEFQRQPQVQVYQNPNVGRTQQGRPDWKQERKSEKHEFRGNRR